MGSVPPLGAPADGESEESEAAEEEAPSPPHKLVAAVVPCMEFVDGDDVPDLSQVRAGCRPLSSLERLVLFVFRLAPGEGSRAVDSR